MPSRLWYTKYKYIKVLFSPANKTLKIIHFSLSSKFQFIINNRPKILPYIQNRVFLCHWDVFHNSMSQNVYQTDPLFWNGEEIAPVVRVSLHSLKYDIHWKTWEKPCSDTINSLPGELYGTRILRYSLVSIPCTPAWPWSFSWKRLKIQKYTKNKCQLIYIWFAVTPRVYLLAR